MPLCSDFTWPWWSAPQMSMRCVPPALELVAVVRDVGEEVGGRAVGTSPARGRAGRRSRSARSQVAPSYSNTTPRAPQVVEHRVDLAVLVQRALGEPRVEVHADAARAPRGSRRRSSRWHSLAASSSVTRVAELGAQLVGHLDEVLAVVAVLGRILASHPREQRRGEGVELVARRRSGSTRGAPPRPGRRGRLAIASPTAIQRPRAGVDRAGRVGGDELEVDPLAREHACRGRSRSPCATTARSTSCSHVGDEVEVEEARGPRPRRGRGARAAAASSASTSLRGDVARRPAERLGELQGDVGGEVGLLAGGSVGGASSTPASGAGNPPRRARRAPRRGVGHGSRKRCLRRRRPSPSPCRVAAS